MRIAEMLLSALLLAACGKETPPPTTTTAEANAPRPVAEQERDLAARLAEQKQALDAKSGKEHLLIERTRRVTLMGDLGKRWTAVIDDVRKTGRSQLAVPIEKMETLRTEAESLDVDECTGKARDTLVRAMGGTLDAVKEFQKQGTGDQTEEISKALQDAQNLVGQSNTLLMQCLV